MDSIKELIGQKVVYHLDDEQIECEVIDVVIDDWYWTEKNEPIMIFVNLSPISHSQGELCVDDFCDVSLEKLTKY